MDRKRVLAAAMLMAGVALFPTTVMADGDDTVTECTTTTQYGGGTKTECKEVPREEVEHEVPTEEEIVDAGLGDVNFVAVAMWLGMLGMGLYGVAQFTKYSYWLD